MSSKSKCDKKPNEKSHESRWCKHRRGSHKNVKILPFIVDAAILCAKQQLAFRGHRDDKIDFSRNPVQNEGIIAVIRLLAEKNKHLLRHLIEGPKNAKYTNKTI